MSARASQGIEDPDPAAQYRRAFEKARKSTVEDLRELGEAGLKKLDG